MPLIQPHRARMAYSESGKDPPKQVWTISVIYFLLCMITSDPQKEFFLNSSFGCSWEVIVVTTQVQRMNDCVFMTTFQDFGVISGYFPSSTLKSA